MFAYLTVPSSPCVILALSWYSVIHDNILVSGEDIPNKFAYFSLVKQFCLILLVCGMLMN
jgi:hypothetical protein